MVCGIIGISVASIVGVYSGLPSGIDFGAASGLYSGIDFGGAVSGINSGIEYGAVSEIVFETTSGIRFITNSGAAALELSS